MSGRVRWVVGRLARWPARGLAAGCVVGLAAAAMGRGAGLVAPVFPFLTLDMMSADGLISLHGCAGPDAAMYGWDVQLLRNRWPHLQWWRFAAWTARNGPRPSWFFGVSAPAWIVIVAALAPDGVRVLRRRRIDPGACACGYDLRGLDPLTSPTCPECGRPRAAEVSGPAARGPAPAGSAEPR